MQSMRSVSIRRDFSIGRRVSSATKYERLRGYVVDPRWTDNASPKYSIQSGSLVSQVSPGQSVGARKIGSGLRCPRRQFDLCGRECVEDRLEFVPRQHERNRRSIKSTKAGLISAPTHLRPSSLAASSVVPEPA